MAIDLHKTSEKAGINLKKRGVDTSRLPPMRVGVCLDVSGSMKEEYAQGHVQNALSHLLALAMHMDKTGRLDVFTFENRASQCREPATPDNYHDFVQKFILEDSRVDKWGGTEYSGVIHLAYEHYYPTMTHLHSAEAARAHMDVHPKKEGFLRRLFHRRRPEEAAPEPAPVRSAPAANDPNTPPTLILFLTDGENTDEDATQHALHATEALPLFWSFVGLGEAHKFAFLQTIAEDLDAEFVNLSHVRISDDELFRELISDKLTAWLRAFHT
jgi:hypothetical protein